MNRCLLAATLALSVVLTPIAVRAQSSCRAAVNQPPNAAHYQKDWPAGPVDYDVTAASSDPDGDPVTLVAVSAPSSGGRTSVLGDQKSVRFEPAAGADWAHFTYTLSDNKSATAQGTVFVGNGLPPVSVTVTRSCAELACTFSALVSPPHEATNARFDWRIVRPPQQAGEPTVTEVNLTGYVPRVLTTQLSQYDRRYEVYLTARTTSGAVLTYEDRNVRTPPVPPVSADLGFDASAGRSLTVWVARSSLNWGGGTFRFDFGDGTNEATLSAEGHLPNDNAPPPPCANGQDSSCLKVVHPYTQLGVYPVTLVVTPYGGAPQRFTRLLEIRNRVPEPRIVVTPVSGAARTWRFDWGSNTRDDLPIDRLTYRWAFGDGAYADQGTEPHVDHQFAAGSYTVTLTATDEDGASGTATVPIDVPNTPPNSSFWIDCTNGRSCVFRAESTDDEGPIQEYQWTAAGQTWSTAVAETPFTFPADGRHVVTLTTVDSYGDSAQASRVVYVNGAVPATPLAFYPIAPCRAYSSVSAGTPLASNSSTAVNVIDRCGVPIDAVAIEANVTATAATGAGHVLAWAADTPAPSTAILSFPAAEARANNATIPAGRGRVNLLPYVSAGAPATVHLLIDVHGYWAPGDLEYAAATPPLYVANSSCLLLPEATRANGVSRIEASWCPWSNAVGAFWATLRVKNPTAAGHMTLYRLDDANPPVSTVNFPASRSISNSTVVRTAVSGTPGAMLAFGTQTPATATVGIDVWANFATREGAHPFALGYVPIPPCRALDTRSADYGMPRSATEPRSVTLVGNCGIPRAASMVRMNVTVVNPQADSELHVNRRVSGYLKAGEIFSAGILRRIYGSTDTVARPYDDVFLSAIQPATGQIVAADFIADVVGYFVPLSE